MINDLINRMKKLRDQAGQTANNAVVKLGQSPVGQGLVNTQRWVESSRPVSIVPQKTPFNTRTVPGQALNAVYNFPSTAINAFVNVPGSIGSDVGRIIGGSVTGQGLPTYSTLKSPFTRLAYNARGQQASPQQILGNIGGAASQALDVYTPASIANLGKRTIGKAGTETFKRAVLRNAGQGMALGGSIGFGQGLSDNRTAPNMGSQIVNAGLMGAGGALAGGALGGVFGGGSHLTGKVVNRLTGMLTRKHGMSPEAAAKAVQVWARDPQGKFTSQKKPQPVFYGDLNEAVGLPRHANTQGGFAKFDEFLPSKTKKAGGAVVDEAKGQIEDQFSDTISAGIQGDDGRVPQVFKTEKFNVNTNQRKTLVDLQKALGLDTRDVRSMDDMREAAEVLGTNPQKLLKDIETGRIKDEEVIALGNLISTSSQRISKLSGDLKKNPGDVNLQAQLAREEEVINQAIKKRIKGGTEAGRAVVAFRNIANRNLEPAYWLDKAKRQIGENKELPADVVNAIGDFIQKKDRLGLAVFVSKLGESNAWEKLVTLWKAGLLTGLRTHEANMISNTAFGTLETIKDIPAAAFDIARSAITRSPRAKTVGIGNVTSQVGGLAKGAKKAWTMIREGMDPDDIAKAEVTRQTRYGESILGKVAQKYTNAVFGMLGAQDKIFREAAFARSLAEQIRTADFNQKLTPQAKQALWDNPTADMLKVAQKDAEYATFTNDNAISDAIRAAKAAGGPGVRTAIDLVMPFTRTPTNVAKATFIDYTPVGVVKTVAQKLFNKKSVSDRELADAFGRAATGTGILWMGAELAKRGLITGPSPSSEAERSQWELEGKTPNSVFLNGKWRNVGRISPMGNLLVLGGQFQQTEGQAMQDRLATTGAAGIKGLSEQSFLKGAGGALKAVNEPDRFGPAFIEGLVGGYVPTLSSDIARGTDPLRRQPKGIGEKILSRLPGLRTNVPAKLNALGQPVEEQGGFLQKIADPFNSTSPTLDPLVREMSRVGYNLNYVGDTIASKKLTREEEREYQRRSGTYIQENLPQIINSPAYQGLGTDQKRDVIEKVVNAAKTRAREELKPQLGTITEEAGQVEAAESVTTSNKPPLVVQFEDTQAKEQVKLSGQPIESNGKLFYPKGDSISSVPLDRPLVEPTLTGNATLDKEQLSDYKGEITKKANDIVTLFKLGRITAEEAEAKLLELDALRNGVSGKGGGKGRKPAIGQTPKLKAISIKRSQGVKVPELNIPQIKLDAAPRRTSALTLSRNRPKIRVDLQTTGRTRPIQVRQPRVRFGR